MKRAILVLTTACSLLTTVVSGQDNIWTDFASGHSVRITNDFSKTVTINDATVSTCDTRRRKPCRPPPAGQ